MSYHKLIVGKVIVKGVFMILRWELFKIIRLRRIFVGGMSDIFGDNDDRTHSIATKTSKQEE